MQMFFNGFCEAMNMRKIAGADKVLFIFDINEKKRVDSFSLGNLSRI